MSDASPRVLLLSFATFPSASGAATRVAQRVTAFSDAGYLIDVLTPKTHDLPHVSKLLGARILRVPMPTGDEVTASERLRPESRISRTIPPVSDQTPAPLAIRYGAFERAVRRQLTSVEYDVVHTTEPFSSIALLEAKAAGTLSARIVFEAEGRTPAPEGDLALGNLLRARERELMRSADFLLAPTEEIGLRAKGLGAMPDRIHVLRPSADLELFQPAGDRKKRASPTVQIAICQASMTAAEVSLLLETVRMIPLAVDVRFIVSAGLTKDQKRRLQLDEVLKLRIGLKEPVLYEELGPFYSSAEIGLILTTARVHGELPPVRLQAIAEMMASGLAMVVPDAPSTREVLEDGRHALFYEPSDAVGLASVLKKLVANTTRRRTLAHNARVRSSEALDERRATARLLGLYGTILSPSIAIDSAAYLDSAPSIQQSLTPSATAPDAGLVPTRPGIPGSAAASTGSSAARRTKRVPLSAARESLPDDPTDPDLAIQKRVLLTDLGSGPATDPQTGSRPRQRR